jgi:FMN phosphatase YigB (HAD superfamily)
MPEVPLRFDDFPALHEFAQKLRSSDSPRLRDGALFDAFQRLLEECRLVSFDIFDTLVVRRVAHPADVFLHLQRHALFRDVPFAKSVARLRIEAEREARQQQFARNGSGEVVLSEIYAEFCRITKLSTDAIQHLVDAEETVETVLCRPNPIAAELLRLTKSAGKEAIAISDTYHRTIFLHRLLEGVGISLPAGSIYASSEHRVHKQGGRLYSVACSDRRIPASEVAHVGDHPISDHQTPRRMGLRPLLHGHFVSPHPSPPFHEGEARWIESAVQAMRAYRMRCGRNNDFWRDLGYGVFGPLFVGFCQWLRDRMVEDGIQRAYFLLREGALLLRVIRCLFGDQTFGTRLLHASRRAMVLPMWATDKEFALSNLLVAYEPRPAREFLERLGLDPTQWTDSLRDAGIPSLDHMVDMRRDGPIMLKAFGSTALQSAMAEAAAKEKTPLVQYLREAGIWDCERTALIDLGWNGTIQKALQVLTTATVPGRRLRGYYLGTLARLPDRGAPTIDASSYWVQGGEPAAEAERLKRLGRLLEIISSSADGSLVRFQDIEGRATPVLGTNPLPASQLEAVDKLQSGILEFANEWRDLAAHLGPGIIPLSAATEECVRLQFSPTQKEASHLGDLALTQDMGTSTIVPLAQFRPESVTPEHLWRDFVECPWREALTNRPCGQAAAVRTLLWLRQSEEPA